MTRGNWSTFQCDVARTGYAPKATAPRSDPIARWTVRLSELVPSSPAVVDGSVYVGCHDGGVYAFDAASGDRQWRVETGDPVRGDPTVVGSTVYVGNEGGLYAIDARRGAIDWEFESNADIPRGEKFRTCPAVTDGTVYASDGVNATYAIDAPTGTVEWRNPDFGTYQGAVAVAGNSIYLNTGRELCAVDRNGDHGIAADSGVRSADVPDGPEWVVDVGTPPAPFPPAVDDGMVYTGAGGGTLLSIDATTGRIEWRYETGTEIRSSPAVGNGTVFVATGDERVCAVDARSGTEEWSFEAIGEVSSSPAVTDGTVCVAGRSPARVGADGGCLYALDAESGAERWRFDVGYPMDCSPAIRDGTVFVTAGDSLYAIEEGGGRDGQGEVVGGIHEPPAGTDAVVGSDRPDRESTPGGESETPSEVPSYCPYCGTGLESYDGVRLCPSCGSELP